MLTCAFCLFLLPLNSLWTIAICFSYANKIIYLLIHFLRFAAPVSSDNKDMAIIRPLLAQTRLEGAQLKLAYDANKDGWNADTFHLKCKGQGWLINMLNMKS